MTLSISHIAAFSDNYFWAIARSGSDKVAVVDPGDAKPVIDYLERTGQKQQQQLALILITHWHPDHIGGVNELVSRYGVPVVGPASTHIPQVTDIVKEGDTVTLFSELFGETLRVIAVPGHTLDHIAYFVDSGSQPRLFCGDTLFSSGCGRLFEGDGPMMWNSLNKIRQLPKNTEIYCAHEYTLSNLKFALAVEPDNAAVTRRIEQVTALRASNTPSVPTTLEQELNFNPFLRCDQKSIKFSISARENVQNCDEESIFTALRRWKDQF
jgi:hydroxyacylglutathione hydrolase